MSHERRRSLAPSQRGRPVRCGGTALREWVRDGLRDPERPENFRAAISFMYAVGRKEAIAELELRREQLEQTIADAGSELAKAAEGGVEEIFLSEERYAQRMREAERDWLAGFTESLRNGSLRWPRSPAA